MVVEDKNKNIAYMFTSTICVLTHATYIILDIEAYTYDMCTRLFPLYVYHLI